MAYLKGLRPLPPTPADSRIFGFLDFSENVGFWNSLVGSGVLEGMQSIDAFYGIQTDGLSARTEPPESMFDDFDYLAIFVRIFDHFPFILDNCFVIALLFSQMMMT